MTDVEKDEILNDLMMLNFRIGKIKLPALARGYQAELDSARMTIIKAIKFLKK